MFAFRHSQILNYFWIYRPPAMLHRHALWGSGVFSKWFERLRSLNIFENIEYDSKAHKSSIFVEWQFNKMNPCSDIQTCLNGYTKFQKLKKLWNVWQVPKSKKQYVLKTTPTSIIHATKMTPKMVPKRVETSIELQLFVFSWVFWCPRCPKNSSETISKSDPKKRPPTKRCILRSCTPLNRKKCRKGSPKDSKGSPSGSQEKNRSKRFLKYTLYPKWPPSGLVSLWRVFFEAIWDVFSDLSWYLRCSFSCIFSLGVLVLSAWQVACHHIARAFLGCVLDNSQNIFGGSSLFRRTCLQMLPDASRPPRCLQMPHEMQPDASRWLWMSANAPQIFSTFFQRHGIDVLKCACSDFGREP